MGPASDPALAAWDDLPEDLRESNRAQVADIPAKLAAIGYEFVPTDDWDADLFRLTQEQVETLARMEHKRYVEERLRAGYRYGQFVTQPPSCLPTWCPGNNCPSPFGTSTAMLSI